MEPLYEDFIKGEEITMIKKFFKNLNVLVIFGTFFGYLIILDLLPRFTIFMTFMGLTSLIITHFFKKWLKKD